MENILENTRYKNEIGNVYGNLVVEEFVKTDKQNSYWKCKCSCGEYKITRGSTLRSGQCKSCGKCDIWKKMSPDAGYRKHFNSTRGSAKSRNLQFTLTFEQFKDLSNQNCYYCGEPPTNIKRAESRRGKEYEISTLCNGIDRINSDFGYNLDNVVSCCFMCNRMKSNFNISDFLMKVRKIYEHTKKTGDSS